MGENRARTDRGASQQRGTIGITGAKHDLLGIETEHSSDQFGKYRLMALAARTRHAVEHDFVVCEKTNRNLIFRGQTAARGLQKYGAPDPAQGTASSRLLS